MSDGSGRPAIPAWQQAQVALKPSPIPSGDVDRSAHTSIPPNAPGDESWSAPDVDASTTFPGSKDEERVKLFLQHADIKDAPPEKKRAFLRSKDIPDAVIDQELGKSTSAFSTTEFATFKLSPTTSVPVPQARAAAPPIITYPEWLAESHKLPPLITVNRVVNTAYIASGLAALIYGASTFLIKPMADSLTESRHEFAAHSNMKVDEFNDRLSRLVSRIPEPKKSLTDTEWDDTASITSDPTELYHRDMGTQTSPLDSTASTPSANSASHSETVKQVERLASLNHELSDILSSSQGVDVAAKERQDELDKLHHELDTMLYRSQSLNVWSTGGNGAEEKGKWEAVEDLKKEIRSVKGVLLSAKRFAPVSGVRAG